MINSKPVKMCKNVLIIEMYTLFMKRNNNSNYDSSKQIKKVCFILKLIRPISSIYRSAE